MKAKKSEGSYSNKSIKSGGYPSSKNRSNKNYSRPNKRHRGKKRLSNDYYGLDNGSPSKESLSEETNLLYSEDLDKNKSYKELQERDMVSREEKDYGDQHEYSVRDEIYEHKESDLEKPLDEEQEFEKDENTFRNPDGYSIKNELPDADMTFTEDEIYGDSLEHSTKDEPNTNNEEGSETDFQEDSARILALTSSQIEQIKRRMHIPNDGFRVTTSGGARHINIEVERINELLEQLQVDEESNQHIQNTINLFTNDTDPNSHQERDQIDIAFILAVAIRESGIRTVLSRSNRRIVKAGRDAHTEGRSGLDWVYDYKRYFPTAIRDEIQPVVGNPHVPGSFRREVHPAYVRERDLLSAFFVEIRQRQKRFLSRFHNHEFSNDFSEEQRNSLLHRLTNDARRAWIQAAFGSKIHDLLASVRQLLTTGIRNGTPFQELVENNQFNLNAIITNDEIMPINLSRQRTRISAAEAALIEENFQNRF